MIVYPSVNTTKGVERVVSNVSQQVHIRVGDGRKDKWEGHANEDHADKYGSISKLIRHAVERQIELDTGGGGVTSGAEASLSGPELRGGTPRPSAPTSEPNGRIDDILTGVEDNGNDLEAIAERLEAIHETLLSQGGMPDSVLSTVYGALPVVESGFGGADKDAVAERFGSTEEEIADETGLPPNEVGRALTMLRHEYENEVDMLMTSNFDAPRYWRVMVE